MISKLLSVLTDGLIAFKDDAYFPFANIKSSSLNISALLLRMSILSYTLAESSLSILSISAFSFSINSFISLFKFTRLIGSINKVAPVEL